MLIRSEPLRDPWRDLDRLVGALARGQLPAARQLPLRAVRTAAEVVLSFDVPGAAPDDIELTVDRNVLSVRATRRDRDPAGAELLTDERGPARGEREVTLSDLLDVDNLSASCEHGVLVVRVPLGRQASPRRIEIRRSAPTPTATPTTSPAPTAAGDQGGRPREGRGTAPDAQPPPPEEQANPAPTS